MIAKLRGGVGCQDPSQQSNLGIFESSACILHTLHTPSHSQLSPVPTVHPQQHAVIDDAGEHERTERERRPQGAGTIPGLPVCTIQSYSSTCIYQYTTPIPSVHPQQHAALDACECGRGTAAGSLDRAQPGGLLGTPVRVLCSTRLIVHTPSHNSHSQPAPVHKVHPQQHAVWLALADAGNDEAHRAGAADTGPRGESRG